MALSFLHLISYFQIFNTLSKTIMSLSRPPVDHCFIQNVFIMVQSTGVRAPSLARLAMVLVLLSIENTPALRIKKYRRARPHSGPLSYGFGMAIER